MIIYGFEWLLIYEVYADVFIIWSQYATLDLIMYDMIEI